jgi:hypothetical protein
VIGRRSRRKYQRIRDRDDLLRHLDIGVNDDLSNLNSEPLCRWQQASFLKYAAMQPLPKFNFWREKPLRA